MITEIALANFKSYQEARLPLAPLTVLIGANASGKSNAIEGLRLLSWLAQGNRLSSIQTTVQDSNQLIRGRIQDLGYNAQSRFSLSCSCLVEEILPLSFMITLEVKSDNTLHLVGEMLDDWCTKLPLYKVVSEATGMGTDLQVEYNNFSKGGHKPKILCSDQFAIFTQLDSPSKFQSHHKKSRQQIPPATANFRLWLSNILFLDPIPTRMRDYSFKMDKWLSGDGKQLSSVLFHLWGGNKTENQLSDLEKSNREDILKFVSSLPEQDIESIQFLSGPRDEVMVKLVETFGGERREYDASLLSDGTLRVLAVAAAMLSAPEGGIVVIEEIDNGVHPSRAKQLLEQIATLADRRKLRILLSSHNPALLDALPNSAVPNVVFCYRDLQNGSSRLIRLQDVPDYPELISQGGIGHLMTTGILERFVKHHPGTEAKKIKAMKWLEDLQRATEEIDPWEF
ncbi:MAG: AAA family ATPase [Magnetococcales bacterium]|nr:AAA family ATPase [Magnetococcales bacterium]